MSEPTNTDILVALSRLDEKVSGLQNHFDRTIERHGREMGDMRTELRLLDGTMDAKLDARDAKLDLLDTRLDILSSRADKAVTWRGLGGLLAVLIPVLAFVFTVLTASWR